MAAFAGKEYAFGNFVLSTFAPWDCGSIGNVQTTFQSEANSSVGNVLNIQAFKSNWIEYCGEVLSSAALGVNFADCHAWNPSLACLCSVGIEHVDVLSAKTGAVLARISDPSHLVNGLREYYPLLAFGYNMGSNTVYALAAGSNCIYKISG